MSKGSAIVNLIATVDAAVQVFEMDGQRWPDSNTSEAFGQICEGLSQLLNEPLGLYDGGELSRFIDDIAERVRWDMQTSEIAYD